ncbi:MAG: hypothetical protein JNL61_18475 [Rhizobiaceae bacterium]|nr:hypothetical protein [Rhizobiaceae bacterium]
MTALLIFSGRGGTGFGAFVSAMALLAVCLTGVRALLRLWTVGVTLEPNVVVLGRGFPYRHPVVVAWHMVADVATAGSAAWSGRALTVEDADGHMIMVRDLADADRAAELIRTRMGQFRGVATLLDGLAARGRTGRG